MYWDIDVTPEEEDEIISKIASKIHKRGLDVAAILMLESIKPMSYIGSQMGRLFVSPFLPAFGENLGMEGEKLLQIFEKRENVEKLLKKVEELKHQEEEQKKAKKAKKLEKRKTKKEPLKKRGWRRFLPYI